MDRTEKRSSIIAISDDNRYLLYYDVNWNCDFFPNHAIADNEDENMRLLSTYLSSNFGIPESDFNLTRVTGESREKYSTEHCENRFYDYTLYKASIIRMPDAWKAGSFHLQSKDCKWMTTDQMMKDPVIGKVNDDVVGMVKSHL